MSDIEENIEKNKKFWKKITNFSTGIVSNSEYFIDISNQLTNISNSFSEKKSKIYFVIIL